MKYLFIDGNNIAIRNSFANAELKNSAGISTGVHYGTFQSLIALKKTFGKEYQYLIVWDGKSKRRTLEASQGVKQGIIKSGYKENREKDRSKQPKPLVDFYEQASILQRAIGETGIPQIRLPDYESDDIIASYCKKFKKDNEIVIITSDRDYYQLLDNNITIYDGMKQKFITKNDFIDEYKIQPIQYIDVGALMGDIGDNIFGIPGWGEIKAVEAIQKHGSWQKVYEKLHKDFDYLRIQYPDITDEVIFKKLENIVTKSGKPKYPEIYLGLPFTGVTLAMEEKKIDKINKDILMALMFEKRVELAYSLKKMDSEILDLPEIKNGSYNKDRIIEYFDYYEISTLKSEINVFE